MRFFGAWHGGRRICAVIALGVIFAVLQGCGSSTGDPNSRSKADAAFKKGTELFNKESYDEALASFSEAINQYPAPLFYISRSNVLIRLNRPDEALRDLSNAEVSGQRMDDLQYLRGLAYAKKGEFETAIDCLTNAITTDSHRIEALCERSRCYMKLGASEKNLTIALAGLDRAIDLEPDCERAFFLRADCYSAMNNPQRASRDRFTAEQIEARKKVEKEARGEK